MITQVKRWLPGALTLVLPLGVYLSTLAPTVTFDDSGQLIVAASKLGIPHPSGYPVFCLVGQIFSYLPIGTMAWRINLASAVAATFASFLLYLLLARTLRPRYGAAAPWAAAVGSLTFAFSRSFWSQAVITEVYALNALNIVLLLYAAMRWVEEQDAKWGYLSCFLAGTALATHSSAGLVVVPLAVYVAWRMRRWPTWRGGALGLALWALAMSIYLYLPVRAVQSPAINWGDPRTWEMFVRHVTRRAYGGPNPERLVFLVDHLKDLGGFLLWQMAPAATALLAWGVIAAWRRRLRPYGFFSCMLLIYGPIATFALVLLLQAHQVCEMHIWHIPLYIFVAAFVAAALGEVLTHRNVAVKWAGGVVAAAAVVFPLALNYGYNDRAGYYYAEDYATNFERTIGYEGMNLMFERGSMGTFETAYLKKVMWVRPDHVFVDGTGCVYKDEYELFGYGRTHASDFYTAQLWEKTFEANLLTTAGPRPVYYSIHRDTVNDVGFRLEPEGILFRAVAGPRVRTQLSPVWGRYRCRGVAEVIADPHARRLESDEWCREAVSRLLIMKGREYLLIGDKAVSYTL